MKLSGGEVFVQQRLNELTETGNELVSDLLYSKRLSMADDDLVFVCEPDRLDLYRKGIEVALPEPVRGAQLHILGINGREFRQVGEKVPALGTILEAKGDIRDPIGYRANVLFGERIKVVRCLLLAMDEMTEAALEGEAVRQFHEARDNLTDGFINALQREVAEFAVPLDLVMWFVDEFSEFREGLNFGAVRFVRLTCEPLVPEPIVDPKVSFQ